MTDFGLSDTFVAQMKGVILSINPDCNIVDITHEIRDYDIQSASLALTEAYRYFPKGSIHIAVVDPGVGSSRRPVIVRSDGYLFVGPDNGIFGGIYDGNEEVYMITNSSLFLTDSRFGTFHGRDIFAPVAAWLSLDKAVGEIGVHIDDYVRSNPDRPVVSDNSTIGVVSHIDKFGNAITDIRLSGDIQTMQSVIFREMTVPFYEYYLQGRDGVLGASRNSSGFLELFIPMGNAAMTFNIKKGEAVLITCSDLL